MSAPQQSFGQAPPIAPEASSPQQPGTEFWVDVRVGSESNNVQDLNQVGFDLNFEQQRLSHVDDEEGSFLGNVQYASNVDSDNGIVSVGVTRTDDEGVSGSGVVARVRVAVGQDVADGTELTFSVQNVQAEDPNDGTIDLAPQDLDVTVQEENQSPDANFTFDPSEPNVGETVTFDAGGSEDPDGTIAEYRWDFDEDGQAEETTPSATTTFSFSSAGEKAVALTVVDDDGATGSATETVPVNAPPTAADDSDQTQEGQSVTTNVLANDTDPDGDLAPSTVAVQSGPSDGSASANSDGTITYAPDEGFTGTDSYTYTVEDNNGAESSEATVTITVESQPPPTASFTFDPSEPNVGETVTFDASGSSDDGSVAEYRWDFDDDGQAEERTQSATTTFSFSSAGEKAVTLTVEDDDGATGSATETVPVNGPPTISGLPETVAIGEDGTAGPIGFSVDDPETPPEDLVVTASSDNADLVPDSNIGIDGSGPDRTLMAAPRTDSSGTADITVTVEDGGEQTASATLTLEVEPVNDPPVVEVNEGLTVSEGDASTITTGALSASDPDDGAADLTFEVTGGPANGTLEVGGSATSSFTQADLESGAISYSHDGSETTEDSFTFALTDAEGAGPEGETFEITVRNRAQVSIRSQKTASGVPVDVPVDVRDFTEVGSVSLVVNYDPEALSFPSGAGTDDLISDAVRGDFTASLLEPGELRISWFQATGANPINVGEGKLLEITFSEFVGDTTEVAFGPNSEISDTDANSIPTAFDGGTVTLDPKVTISGSVAYPGEGDSGLTGGRPLSGVPVEISAPSGDVAARVTTGNDGTFSATVQAGEYTVEALFEERDVPGVINATDARRTIGAFLGDSPFVSDFQREVADVNDSGSANATDALKMALFFIDRDGTTFEAGDWATTARTVDVSDGTGTDVSVLAAAYGDANLSGGEQSGEDAVAATASTAAGSSAGSQARTNDDRELRGVGMEETFEVPVRLNGGEATVGAYSLQVDFPGEKVSFEGVAGTERDVMSAAEGGTVRLSWFDQSGDEPVKLGSGAELVTLRFRAAKSAEKGMAFAPEVTVGELAGPDAEPLTSARLSVEGVEIGSTLPEEFALEGNYPNPTSGQATIEMNLPSRTDVTVEVYNALGQRVQVIEQSMAAGTGQTVRVDGSRLASGQYFYRVKADLEDGTAEETGQLTVIK